MNDRSVRRNRIILVSVIVALVTALLVGVTLSAKPNTLQFYLGLGVGILGGILSTAIWDLFIKPTLTEQFDEAKQADKIIDSLRNTLLKTKVLARVHHRHGGTMNDEISTTAIRIAGYSTHYQLLAASGNVASFRLAELAKRGRMKGTRVTLVVESPALPGSDREKIFATLGFLAECVATRSRSVAGQAVAVKVYFSNRPIGWHVEFGDGGLFAFESGYWSQRYYEFRPGDDLSTECEDLFHSYIKEPEASQRFLTLHANAGQNATACLTTAIAAVGDPTIRASLQADSILDAATKKRPTIEAMRVFPSPS